MEGKPLASNGNKPGSNGGGGHETKSQKAWQLRLKAEKNTKREFCCRLTWLFFFIWKKISKEDKY